MSVWEALVAGVFGLADTALTFALLIFLFWALRNSMAKLMSGDWGKPSGELFAFDPRRIWCKHPVKWYGPGTHGLWAVWCDRCGKKAGGR